VTKAIAHRGTICAVGAALALAAGATTVSGETPIPFSITVQDTTAKKFAAGQLPVGVHCPSQCDATVTVEVSSSNARRLGMLSFRSPPALGTAAVSAHAAGSFELMLAPTGSELQSAMGFPLFKALPVTIVAKSGGAEARKKISLRWPKQRAERGGHGDGPFFKSITGPRRVSLKAKYASFRVRIARIPGARTMTAIVVTPGLHYTPVAPDALPNSVADRGGTFTVKVPIRSARGRGDAVKLAPLAAELSLGLVTRTKGDSAIFRFTLVK
jgi:hypothetical protein